MPAGIYLTAPHAQWIYAGKKKLIVKARRFHRQVGKVLVLCGPRFLWGLIVLHPPKKISLEDFGKLRNLHQISEEERQKWWPSKEELYAYGFDFTKLNPPVPWDPPRGIQTFVHEVPLPQKYLKHLHELKFISDVQTYDPSGVDDRTLLDDHRILHAWAAVARTRRFKIPLSLIKRLHDAIVKEMKRRKMHHHSPLSETFARVNQSNDGKDSEIYLHDILDDLGDFRLQAPAAWIVGGLANHGKTRGDIDILIRAPPPFDRDHFLNDLLSILPKNLPQKLHHEVESLVLRELPASFDPSLPFRFRMLRQLDVELWDRLQFLFDTHGGPFTNAVPLYDAVCIRTDPEKLLMSESSSLPLGEQSSDLLLPIFFSATEKMAEASKKEDAIKPMRFFYLAKPLHGRTKEEIYSPDSVIRVMKSRKKDWFKIGIVCEKKFDGVSAFIHKVGDRVKLLTDDGGDVTDNAPTLVAEIKEKWKNIDIVAASELELWLGGKHQPRADTNGVLHGTEHSEQEKFIRANFYDVLWIHNYESGKLDLHNKPFHERLAWADGLPTSKLLVRSERKIAHSEAEVRKYIDYFSHKPGSEGCFFKLLDFQYPLTGRCYDNMKFKKELSLDCKVAARMRVKGSADTFYYHIALDKGVYCGKTANTNLRASVGSIVKVIFSDISKYTDPQTGQTWFALWGPARVAMIRHDKKRADSQVTATKIVAQTTQRIDEKRLPKDIRDLIVSGEVKLSLTPTPGYMKTPSESKKWLGMLQLDSRKKNVGIDFRWQVGDDEIAAFTVFVPKGLSRAPKNPSEAKTILTKEILPLVKDTLSNPLKKFNCQPKKNITAGRRVFKEMIGFGPGYDGQRFMWTVDSFEIEHGAKKSDFVELFIRDGFAKGRVVFVKIPNRKEWTKTPEGIYTWMMFKTTNETPYVLSRRASSKRWIPPVGVSALPASIRKNIPKEFQFWKAQKESDRLSIRDELLKAIKLKKVRLTFRSTPVTLNYSASFDPSKFERTPEGLLIKDVCALGVGAWKGANMEFALWNSPEFIKQVFEICPKDLLLCSEHECFDPHGNLDPSQGIGKAFNFRLVDDDLVCDVLVTSARHIELVESGHYNGVSLHTDAFICFERRFATDPIAVKELSLCVVPACKVCFLPGNEAACTA